MPHLHLQLQLYPAVGAANIPFLFRDLLVEEAGHCIFHPLFKPEESLIVSPMPPNETHRLLLYPRNGESWHLEAEESGKEKRIISWKFTYSLYGNVLVTSAEGEEIEYQVGLKSVEVIRFSPNGFSPLNLFALSLADMPFALTRDLKWKSVLFGRHAYHFLSFPKRILSWIVGDLFSAICFKTVFEDTREDEENSGASFSIVSDFSSLHAPQNRSDMQILFHFGPTGFLSLCVKSDTQVLVQVKRIASE